MIMLFVMMLKINRHVLFVQRTYPETWPLSETCSATFLPAHADLYLPDRYLEIKSTSQAEWKKH